VRVTVAVGVLCAVWVWGPWGPLGTAIGVMVPAFGLARVVGVPGVWAQTRVSMLVALTLVACGGVIAAFHWSGLAWLVLLGATAPVVGAFLRSGRLWAGPSSTGGWEGWPVAGPATVTEENHERFPDVTVPLASQTALVPLTELPDAAAVSGLDDRALCRAWRRSYVQLEGSMASSRREEVVGLRQLYLDELARRHPDEVRRWLASGARAAGNPLPFLERPSRSADAGTDLTWPDPD